MSSGEVVILMFFLCFISFIGGGLTFTMGENSPYKKSLDAITECEKTLPRNITCRAVYSAEVIKD